MPTPLTVKGKTMTDIERDKLIVEMHQDIKWLKGFNAEHRATHAKYLYYFVLAGVGIIISMFK